MRAIADGNAGCASTPIHEQAACRRSGACTQQMHDLALVGEAIQLLLREDQVAIAGDLEITALADPQRHTGEPPAKSVQKLIRQTDGMWLVVSGVAVGDRNVH